MRENYALIIENPVSGNAKRYKNETHKFIKNLSEHSFICKTYITSKRGDAVELIRRYAAGMDIIVCCGGDGTLHEVVNGLICENLNIPIYYFPVGTTNDMAHTLGISGNIKVMSALLNNGEIYEHDAGIFNDDMYLTYSASFGAFSEISYKTPQRLKNRLGYISYWLYGIKSLSAIKPYNAYVKADEQQFEGRFIFGCISNSTSVGGVLKLERKNVNLSDGRMEMLLIRYPDNFTNLTRTLFKLMCGNYFDKNIVLTSAKQISIYFKENVEWTVDGEYAGIHQKAKIEVKHKAYKILAPVISTM